MLTDQSHRWLRLHRHWHGGRLLTAGGVMDQPAAYLEAMELIDAAT